MKKRLVDLPKNHSFFLFGPRGVGKSTLLRSVFAEATTLWIDLLDPEWEQRLISRPSDLQSLVNATNKNVTHVVIDEIQKVPALLNVVHQLIEQKQKHFVMTGSSARKLRRSGVNLLAGRAFIENLHTFSCFELGDVFDLDELLAWGSLPKIFELSSAKEKTQYLQAYSQTYLKEEIAAEQIVRNLGPFRKFLEVASQSNGKIVNFANIARDVGVDDKTVKEYFRILEDTLVGFHLEAFVSSFRKRLSQKPKFFFFDIGVVRSLKRMLSVPLHPSTSEYGDTFEHFVINECIKLRDYYQTEYRFSYIQTKDEFEVDLVIERPGRSLLFVEIKSSQHVDVEKLRAFTILEKDFPGAEFYCLSQDRLPRLEGTIQIWPWKLGLEKIFLKTVSLNAFQLNG